MVRVYGTCGRDEKLIQNVSQNSQKGLRQLGRGTDGRIIVNWILEK